MSTKKETALAARIKKDNAAYEAMNHMQRRVVVSKEILLMIDNGTFTPGSGYGRVRMVNGEDAELPPVRPREQYSPHVNFPLGDLQPIIRAGGFECVGCAKAAVIVARAAVGNKVKITKRSLDEEGDADPLAHRVSKEVFGEKCSNLIEWLYEDWSLAAADFIQFIPRDSKRDNWTTASISGEMHAAYTKYRHAIPLRHVSPKARMMAIYRNIVDNKGHLVIGDYKY